MRRLAILVLLWLTLAVAATVAVSCGPEPARDEPVPPSSAYEPGEVIWSYRHTGGAVWSSTAVADGVVYVGSADGYVYALDAENGALLWSSAIDSAVLSSPVVIDGRVYVSSENGLVYALKAWPGE